MFKLFSDPVFFFAFAVLLAFVGSRIFQINPSSPPSQPYNSYLRLCYLTAAQKWASYSGNPPVIISLYDECFLKDVTFASSPPDLQGILPSGSIASKYVIRGRKCSQEKFGGRHIGRKFEIRYNPRDGRFYNANLSTHPEKVDACDFILIEKDGTMTAMWQKETNPS